jgi:3-phytase
VALVTALDRADDTIAILRVDPATRGLVDVAARRIELGISSYGSCMYRSRASGKFYLFANSEKGEVEQWELVDAGEGKVDATRVRSFDVGTQTEGCAADDGLGLFFIGEERVGIWMYGAEPDAGTARTKVDSTKGTGHLKADVEGLTIAYGAKGRGYLIASSQGDSTYTVYRRGEPPVYLGSFQIVDGQSIDGTKQTDGIDVTTAALGPSFPRGVFVAQDGKNGKENQNFKLVPWERILLRTG